MSKNSVEQVLNMPCRDKSEEFSHVVLSLRGKFLTKKPNLWGKERRNFGKSYYEFMEEAKSIGKKICETHDKLQRLKHLSKRKSLFKDNPLEIECLIKMVKVEIDKEIEDTSTLQNVARENNNLKMSLACNRDALSHCSNAVLSLQSKLASVSEEFRQTLELRNENERQMTDRKEQFQQNHLSTSFPQCAIAGNLGSVLLTEQTSYNTYPSEPQQSQMQITFLDESEDYVSNRTQSMQQIESTIIELGKVFQHLAVMVKEQEETIRRIDENIIHADINVKSAHDEILRYSHKIMSNRWLMIKIFGTLAFISTCFFIFIA